MNGPSALRAFIYSDSRRGDAEQPSISIRLFSEDYSGWLQGAIPDSIGGTTFVKSPASQLLNRATGFMNAYDFTLNPYSGCSFGCTYCYAAFFSRDVERRDTWGQVGQRQGERRRTAKEAQAGDAGRQAHLHEQRHRPLSARGAAVGAYPRAAADDSRPRRQAQTGGCKTRSPDVVRDCDLFRRIEENGGRVQVNMTVTTDDEDIRRTFEPHCPSNPRRLDAIGKVQAARIDTCITMTPLLLVSSPLRLRRQPAGNRRPEVHRPAVPLQAGQVPGRHP